jgi:transcriptional regulator with PAS, ATPase and Fis domain
MRGFRTNDDRQVRISRARSPSESKPARNLFDLAASPEADLRTILSFILGHALEISSARGGVAFFANPDTQQILCLARTERGIPQVSREELESRWSEQRQELFGKAPHAVQILDLDNLKKPVHGPVLFPDTSQLIRIPLLAEEGQAGLLQLETSQRRIDWTDLSQSLAELARQAETVLWRRLLSEHAERQGFGLHFVGGSRELMALEEQVRRIARNSKSPVLILGERGSGKELTAYAIHYYSKRRHAPFLALNSASLTETLFADELFGHEPGAFTGAAGRRSGMIQAAEGGTLFFDEIGDMTLPVQAALLRFLENRELRMIGSDRPRRLDVRIVAATNQDLQLLVKEGRFRNDVYDRLDVFQVLVPPLRARREDIRPLTSFFLGKLCNEIGRHEQIRRPDLCKECRLHMIPLCAHSSFYEALGSYDFPGNVRELRNLIVRLASLVLEEKLGPEHLASLRETGSAERSGGDLSLDGMIRCHIEHVLAMTGHNKSAAARELKLPLTTLVNKMKRLGIE